MKRVSPEARINVALGMNKHLICRRQLLGVGGWSLPLWPEMHLERYAKQLLGIFQPWTCSIKLHRVCAPTLTGVEFRLPFNTMPHTLSLPWGNYTSVYCFLKICITSFKSHASVVFNVSIKASLQGHAAEHEQQELQVFFWEFWTELLPCHTRSESQTIGINDVNYVSVWYNSDVYQQISRPWGHRLPQAQSSHKSSLSEPFISSKFTILECRTQVHRV